MDSSYTQDVEFNSGFGVLQTPVHIFSAAVINNIKAPPINKPFRFLDLACGNGLTLALLADAYPYAEFVGIDINRKHIQKANARALAAKLTNVSYSVGDILSLNANDFEPFDYCAVGGVYSWLDAARRDSTRLFLKDAVRAGGLIYMDYSAQPGMAQTAPLYNLLRELGKGFEGSSAEKLTMAAKMADKMRLSGARFFSINPLATSRLETILRNPPEDEAHEVFNLQGTGFWSCDVIRDMSNYGIDYAANAGLHHNIPALSSRPELLTGSDGYPVHLREMVFDFNWNIPHRRDVYIRSNVSTFASNLEQLNDLNMLAIGATLNESNRKKLNSNFPNSGICSHDSNSYANAALSAGTFGEVFDRLRRDGWTDEKISEFTRQFLALRLISIALERPEVPRDVGPVEMSSALNALILREDIGAQYSRPFASRIAGTRILLPLKDRLYLWALLGHDLTEAWEKLGVLREMFRDENNAHVDKVAFQRIIKHSLPGFKRHVVPELLRMKILKTA